MKRKLISGILTACLILSSSVFSLNVKAEENSSYEFINRFESEDVIRQSIVDYAYRFLGVPYVYGGTTPDGFDCSGFVKYVYWNEIDYELPRVTYSQRYVGKSVSYNDLKVGDLVFTNQYGHVGIYVGGGQYIHSPQVGDVVKVSKITNFVEGRRIEVPKTTTKTIEVGKVYQFKNTSGRTLKLGEAQNSVDYVYGFNDNEYIYSNKGALMNFQEIKDGQWIRFCKTSGENFEIKVPYEYKNNIIESDIPIFEIVKVNKGEVIELNDSENKNINFTTSANNDITYSQISYKGKGKSISNVKIDEFETVHPGSYSRLAVEKGDSLELYIPYEYKDCYKKEQGELFEKYEIQPNECYEFRNNLQGSKGKTDFVIEGFINDDDGINYIQYDYNGNLIDMKSEDKDKLSVLGGEIIKFDVKGDKAKTIYIPKEFKDSIKKIDGQAVVKNIISNGNSKVIKNNDLSTYRVSLVGNSSDEFTVIEKLSTGDTKESIVKGNKYFNLDRGTELTIIPKQKESYKVYEPNYNIKYGYEREDINKDGEIDIIDFAKAGIAYNKTYKYFDEEKKEFVLNESFDQILDLNNDESINQDDLTLISQKFIDNEKNNK